MKISTGQKNLFPRPLTVTAVALLLILVGIGANLYFAPDNIKFISKSRGTPLEYGYVVYTHLLWLVLAVAGFGLLKGSRWSRPLLIVALIGMLLVAVFETFEFGALVTPAFVYCLIIWLLFRPKSNRFFESRRAPIEHQAKADGAD